MPGETSGEVMRRRSSAEVMLLRRRPFRSTVMGPPLTDKSIVKEMRSRMKYQRSPSFLALRLSDNVLGKNHCLRREKWDMWRIVSPYFRLQRPAGL